MENLKDNERIKFKIAVAEQDQIWQIPEKMTPWRWYDLSLHIK